MLDPELQAVDRALIADVYLSDEPWKNLVTLCEEFGSRFGGTEGERGARDFIRSRFEAYGMDRVAVEEFPYNGWVRGTARLEVLAPRPMEIPCIALPYCPPGTVEADLVYLGDGHPDDYAAHAERLRGSICMVTTRPPRFLKRGMHRVEKFGRAVAASAAGFIWMRHEGGLLPETGSLRFDREAEIPGVGVSYEHGMALVRMAKDGPVRVRISGDHVTRPMLSWNIVGELEGRTRPEEILVVGAHFDGHDISVGAADDGAGACVVLEAARALAAHKAVLGRTIRFVTFPLEEIGLIGAENYVRMHAGELGRFVFMLNLDGAGGSGETMLVLQGWPDQVPVFKRLVEETKEAVTVGDRVGLYSDMYPFAMAGVPSATMATWDPKQVGRGWGHTAADTLDKVNPRDLRRDALVVARLLLRLATREDFRPAHKTPADMRKLLEADGLVEILAYEGRPVPG